ncbi:hypothetical protein NDU88_000093 [Pleurodeles waltl]|uniref:Uncharacterized protein n=1 Tax=Pleurodeles waltl TaxID=8319 RepID=A0AAV7P012_PLEWA|nr:hypothetical protein NDU88_000093 [Pleurodeles waltl]
MPTGASSTVTPVVGPCDLQVTAPYSASSTGTRGSQAAPEGWSGRSVPGPVLGSPRPCKHKHCLQPGTLSVSPPCTQPSLHVQRREVQALALYCGAWVCPLSQPHPGRNNRALIPAHPPEMQRVTWGWPSTDLCSRCINPRTL